MANEKKTVREPSFILALVPIVAMIAFMLYCFRGHSETGYHDAHLPLVMSIIVACIVGFICGHSFQEMLAGMVERLAASMEAVLILATVGFLVTSFMLSGAIPTMIVYGLDLLTPKLFLPVGCILCAIVGMACGSSWTTTATIGLAFLGIGAGLGIPAPITAGMIISGAYVGDKFSPLSDTTNLASGITGTNIFSHIGSMLYTTVPATLVALGLYWYLGLNYSGGAMPDLTPITDALNLQAMKLVGANIRQAYANGKNAAARDAMMYASALAGMGFGNTRREARQLVNHGHFTVNGKRVNIPSFQVKPGDVVAVCEKSRTTTKFKSLLEENGKKACPKWIEKANDAFEGKVVAMPARDDIDYEVAEHLIVELYSK